MAEGKSKGRLTDVQYYKNDLVQLYKEELNFYAFFSPLKNEEYELKAKETEKKLLSLFPENSSDFKRIREYLYKVKRASASNIVYERYLEVVAQIADRISRQYARQDHMEAKSFVEEKIKEIRNLGIKIDIPGFDKLYKDIISKAEKVLKLTDNFVSMKSKEVGELVYSLVLQSFNLFKFRVTIFGQLDSDAAPYTERYSYSTLENAFYTILKELADDTGDKKKMKEARQVYADETVQESKQLEYRKYRLEKYYILTLLEEKMPLLVIQRLFPNLQNVAEKSGDVSAKLDCAKFIKFVDKFAGSKLYLQSHDNSKLNVTVIRKVTPNVTVEQAIDEKEIKKEPIKVVENAPKGRIPKKPEDKRLSAHISAATTKKLKDDVKAEAEEKDESVSAYVRDVLETKK